MNLNSIISKLLVAYLVIVGVFIFLAAGQYFFINAQLHKNVNSKYHNIEKYISSNRLNYDEMLQYLASLNFEFVQNPQSLPQNEVIALVGPRYDAMNVDDAFFFNIRTPFGVFLFKDLNEYPKNYGSFWVIGILFIVISGIFFWIYKTLKPLQNLKNQIQKFSTGNLNIECKSDKKDEIAEVANEFDNAVKKIALLLESRQLFLRTIMHELKTPIAKGKIVSNLIEDEVQKGRILHIFDKLNNQIDDFARIERVLTKNYKINKSRFSTGAIVNCAVEMMMLESSDEKIKVLGLKNRKLNVDLELFSLAVKNLLDNGLKYSINNKVAIKDEDGFIAVISKGPKLSHPLKEYFKPFHNDTKSRNHGMGLGLYIVHSIALLHNMSLEYLYDDGLNIFKIITPKEGNDLQVKGKS